MSQVNLLPPEILQRQRIRQRTVLVAIVGGAVVMAILALFFFQSFRLSQVNGDLDTQEQANADLETQIAGLSQYGDLEAELKEKQKLEAEVYMDEIAWSGILGDISVVIPADAVLTAYSGEETVASAADEAGAATEAVPGAAAPGELVGTMNFTVSVAGIDTVTEFLARLGEVDGWANPYTTNVTQTEPRSGDYDFTATVDLTKDSITQRGQGKEPGS